MCLVLAAAGLLAVMAVGWRQVRGRAGHAVPALGLAAAVTIVVLAYPAWFGVAGPQSVSGMLFALAPVLGVPLSGVLSPGQYRAAAGGYIRFGGYLGHNGPPADYVGGGVALAALAAVAAARRRPLTWLLLFMAAVTLALALGAYLEGAPSWLGHPWLPWRELYRIPVIKEILPDQLTPLLTLFVAFLLAVGLDALYVAHRRPTSWVARNRTPVVAAATALVAVVAVVPVFVTFDLPLRVEQFRLPAYVRQVAPTLPANSVLLTIPFALSGSPLPMLWQAVDGMHFRLAGAALKTPNALGAPVGRGAPGSAWRIVTDLTIVGDPEPTGTAAQIATVRHALQEWQVDRVVITGASRDPVYASGFFTMALGVAPSYVSGAWMWTLQRAGPSTSPAVGGSLPLCRGAAAAPAVRADPLAMARCVLFGAGRA